jgi:hypothetical protein
MFTFKELNEIFKNAFKRPAWPETDKNFIKFKELEKLNPVAQARTCKQVAERKEAEHLPIEKMYVLPTGYKYTSQGSAKVVDVPPDHAVVLLCENILTTEQRTAIMHHWTIAMDSKGTIPFIAQKGIQIVIIRKQAP